MGADDAAVYRGGVAVRAGRTRGLGTSVHGDDPERRRVRGHPCEAGGAQPFDHAARRAAALRGDGLGFSRESLTAI